MKHIKEFKLFESKSIDDICKEYGIKNYTINTDGIVDVNGDVDLSYKRLSKIPVKFGHVTGNFGCDNNQLTSLEGCPKTVGGDFFCYDNKLTSLEGCSTEVSGNFFCHNNQLTTLEGGPSTVGGGFWCEGNQLTTLEGCPRTVGGSFMCYNNQLTTLEGGPHTVGQDLWCYNNQLTSLEGCPTHVGGHFHCSSNKLTSLEGCPTEVGGDFYCFNNKLNTLEGLTDVSIGGVFFYKDNPIYRVTKGWLINEEFPDMGLIELFNDISVVVGNKIYLPKLEYFHDEIGIPLPDLEEVKKYYEVK